MMILEPLNVITISFLRGVCKKFNYVVNKKADSFHNFDSLNMISSMTNIHILKILQKFSCITHFHCHSKVTTSELARFLDIVRPTIKEFYTRDSHIDFSKMFRTLRLPTLEKFVFTDTKKVIQDVDIRSLIEGCPNIKYLDLSNIPAVDNRLITKALEKLNQIETFKLLKNTKVNYEIFLALSLNCPNLKHLEIGGLPNEFNNNITYEGIESLTKLKSKLKVIKFEYCAKIGDLCIQTLVQHFGPSLEEFSVIRNYFEKVAKISDESLKVF